MFYIIQTIYQTVQKKRWNVLICQDEITVKIWPETITRNWFFIWREKENATLFSSFLGFCIKKKNSR